MHFLSPRILVALTIAMLPCFVLGANRALAAEEGGHAGRKPVPTAEEIAKLPPDGGPDYNRLVFEKSPYLLQHAGNPVDWFPWGEEPFEKARAEGKPIFLSIGYSTCHWCHVMERESFEDDEVAALMNEGFIAIKVDREERPDIDEIYMTVTQAMTGRGGWPMTVFLTADKKPFFAGTYFPKTARLGRPGMMELLPRVTHLWANQRQELLSSANDISQRVQQLYDLGPGSTLDHRTLDYAYRNMTQRFDEEKGGFSDHPKFPTPHNILFLLRYWKRTGDAKALEMAEKTLTEMRRGGIYDHVGFGFHRYSTDRVWLVPHFEKMLYDQALIAVAYTEAYQATRNEEFARTVEEIFTYVLRDMTSPEGGFFSAEDADSEGEEGKFYLWTIAEVEAIVGEEDANIFANTFNLTTAGNFVEPGREHVKGRNIPHVQSNEETLADYHGMSVEAYREKMEAIRAKLFEAREGRIHPLKDDKILADWNGLMIAALAKAARVLDSERAEDAARRAADFVLTQMRREDGRLYHRYRLGEAGLEPVLEDYAYVTWGLLELYETTFETRWLEEAIALTEITMEQFADKKNGGFFKTAEGGEKLLMRPKEGHDGARPSGNSVTAMNLLRVGRITGEPKYEQAADGLLSAFSKKVERTPTSFNQMLCALDFAVGPSFEVVIAGNAEADDTAAMLRALRSEYLPNKVVLFREDGKETEQETPIWKYAAYTEAQHSLEGKATAYVCQNYACKAPTTDPAAMLDTLRAKPGSKGETSP